MILTAVGGTCHGCARHGAREQGEGGAEGGVYRGVEAIGIGGV